MSLRLGHRVAINCVHAAKDSTVFIGMSDGIIVQMKSGAVVGQVHLKNAGVGFILDDRNGFIVGGSNGIYRFERGKAEAYLYCSASNGLPENYATCGAVDREGDLWLGLGSKGVAKLSDRKCGSL